MTAISQSIFKAYDIRGIVDKTLTEDVCFLVGQALGTKAREKGVSHICVGRDGRLSGPRLQCALMRGIREAGIGVYDIGAVPTPVLYFSTVYLKTGSGVAVTGSHNPPDYNGLKMMMAGETLYGETIQDLYKAIVADKLYTAEQKGSYEKVDVLPAYMKSITDDVKFSRPIKVAIDAGNGIAGPTAAALFKTLGAEVEELYTDVDGNFPNHHPDPSKPANLQDLIKALKEGDSEVGLAFDGDGDRLGVVTKDGEIIYPDRQAMLFAGDILSKRPGATIVYDVKCTRNIKPFVESRGGKAVMSRTGHSLIKAKMKEVNADFAGEMSGHIFFHDRWPGFDDGVYAGTRMIEILTRFADANEPLKNLPNAVSTPELQIPTAEGENFELVEKIKQNAKFEDAKDIITIDGIRVEWDDGFALARPSNTTPVVVLRFEADSEDALKRIQQRFKDEILRVEPNARIPF
ncbi:phosphomannomutase/phosphoglucomutase [Turicimonas muris]|uniref:phosphomannomutase/phosphoglucomutase n=3 Tax=Turicimonas muris TaxID=1796652 RepID=UPI0025A58201|nr:phosphomannomutase/phosphoglucomutase [Turicimonas muris]MBS4767616.1 phosphomannomutase/phosphoglucomutase [Burkholderiales bacterium]